MTRSKPLHVGIGIALAILFTVTTSSLEAGWHHAPVQRAAHASSGGSSGGSSGHCHGGLVRGLLGSLHQHHWQGRYVYSAGHFSSGGSSGGAVLSRRIPRRLYYTPPTVVPTPAPTKEPTAAPEKPAAKPAEEPKAAPEKPAKDPAGQAALDSGKAIFNIQVPEDARVFVNNIATKTPGENRRYVSHGLKIGYRYTYEVPSGSNPQRQGNSADSNRPITSRANWPVEFRETGTVNADSNYLSFTRTRGCYRKPGRQAIANWQQCTNLPDNETRRW